MSGDTLFLILDHDQVEMLLRAHREAIRAHPLFRNAQIIFICEKNMGFVAGFMTNVFHGDRNFLPLAEKIREGWPDYGWNTTHERKVLYAQECADEIRKECIRFMDDMIVANPFYDKADKVEKTIATLFEQLQRYSIRTNKGTFLFLPSILSNTRSISHGTGPSIRQMG